MDSRRRFAPESNPCAVHNLASLAATSPPWDSLKCRRWRFKLRASSGSGPPQVEVLALPFGQARPDARFEAGEMHRLRPSRMRRSASTRRGSSSPFFWMSATRFFQQDGMGGQGALT